MGNDRDNTDVEARLERLEKKMDQLLALVKADARFKAPDGLMEGSNGGQAEFGIVGESLIETDETGALRIVSNRASGKEQA